MTKIAVWEAHQFAIGQEWPPLLLSTPFTAVAGLFQGLVSLVFGHTQDLHFVQQRCWEYRNINTFMIKLRIFRSGLALKAAWEYIVIVDMKTTDPSGMPFITHCSGVFFLVCLKLGQTSKITL